MEVSAMYEIGGSQNCEYSRNGALGFGYKYFVG